MDNNKKTYWETKKKPAVTMQEIEMGKMPPHASELEGPVISAAMIDRECLLVAVHLLRPESFYQSHHQVIFKAIVNLFNRSEPVDMLTVYQELKKEGKTEEIGGVHALSAIQGDSTAPTRIDYYCRILVQKHLQRELIRFGNDTIINAYEEGADIFELIDNTEKSLRKVTTENINKDSDSTSDLIHKSVKDIEKAIHRKTGLTGVPSGLNDIDKLTSGWQPSDLIIIGARTSQGKTSLALTFARNAAVDFRIPVGIFSLEMSSPQLIKRLISSEAEISSDKLQKGQLTPDELGELVVKIGRLSDAPIHIDNTAALSVAEFKHKSRVFVEEMGCEMLVVDYIQLMTAGADVQRNREQEIGYIVNSIKATAKELNVPIIALAQLNREMERRGGAKRPQLSDLRESSSLEMSSDIVMLLHRQDGYGSDKESIPNSAEIIFAKHRNGPLENIMVKFRKDITKFIDLPPTEFIPNQPEVKNEFVAAIQRVDPDFRNELPH